MIVVVVAVAIAIAHKGISNLKQMDGNDMDGVRDNPTVHCLILKETKFQTIENSIQ